MSSEDDELRSGAHDVRAERRRFPRVEIFGQVQGRVLRLDIRITVVNIGLGGLLVETVVQLPTGRLLEVFLTLESGESVIVLARAVRSFHATGSDGLITYFTGLEFEGDGTEYAQLAMDRLLAEYPVA